MVKATLDGDDVKTLVDKGELCLVFCGEWKLIGRQLYECTVCKRIYNQSRFDAIKLKPTDPDVPPYCPWCGSRNRMEV